MPQSRIFQGLLYMALAIILFLAISPADHQVTSGINDKVGHIAAFILLGILAQQAFPSKSKSLSLYTWLLAYGIGIEIIQYFIPYRSFSLLDMVADASGLGIAYLFVFFLSRRKNLIPD